MTKQQIKHYLRHGCRATHDYFSKNEWVKQVGNQMVMEDGASILDLIFWKDRENNSGWDDSWSVICDTRKEHETYLKATNIPDHKDYYPKPDYLTFDIESAPQGGLWMQQAVGRHERKNAPPLPVHIIDYISLINFHKNIMNHDKQAPKLRRIIHAEKAREISNANNPEAIRNKIADDVQKAITNAALAGENKVTFRCTIPNYRYFIHELLIAGGYTFSNTPKNFDDIHISWKIDLIDLINSTTKSKF